MDKKHYAFFLKKRHKHKKSNPVAKVLKLFTPKIIQDKTKYTRKLKHKTMISPQ